MLTGVTRLQCGYEAKLSYVSNARSIADGLRLAGYEVDQRSVAPGDDLGEYDTAVVGIAPPLSMTTDWLYSTLYVVEAAKRFNVKLVFFVDDWHYTGTVSQLRTIATHGEHQLVKPFFNRRKHYDWALEHVGELMETCRTLLETPWPATLVPAFTWGNRAQLEKYLPTDRVEYVDLSVVAERYHTVAQRLPIDRRREWVLGVLQNEQPWVDSLDLEWPVRYHGGRASKAEAGGLAEADLLALYGQSWGVLSPPHVRVRGTGWWRYRVTMAREAGAVLLSDPREVYALGEAYTVAPSAVEAMDAGELCSLAVAQAEAYDAVKQSLPSLEGQLRRVIETAEVW